MKEEVLGCKMLFKFFSGFRIDIEEHAIRVVGVRLSR